MAVIVWNQCLSPLMLWVQISIRARCTTLCDKVCQWLATDQWFSPGPSVSSTDKTDRHDITEILLKVALHPIKQTNKQINLLLLTILLCEIKEKNVKIIDNKVYSTIPLTMTYFSDLVTSVYKTTCHLCCHHFPNNSLGNI